MYKSIIRPILFKMDAEKAHSTIFAGLKLYKYLSPIRGMIRYKNKSKQTVLFREITLRSRVGLAAGMDKAAEVFDELADFGFGFLEIGTVTPSPQLGNPKPRIFRLEKDASIIARTGFNNPGLEVVKERISKYTKRAYRLGANINRDAVSNDKEAIVNDFSLVFSELYNSVDYFTINWGSIDSNIFEDVLESLTNIRRQMPTSKKIMIKLPADIEESTILNIIMLARKYSTDGFIATGPTMDRGNLICLSRKESERIGVGGVSGKGIGNKSKSIVKFLGENVKGEFIIIGSGGIMCAQDAVDMINLGADLLQIYSAFIFQGPEIVDKINNAILNK